MAGSFLLCTQEKGTKEKGAPMSWPAAPFVSVRRDWSRRHGIHAVTALGKTSCFADPAPPPSSA